MRAQLVRVFLLLGVAFHSVAGPLENWTSTPIPATNLTGLAFGNGLFVAVAAPSSSRGWVGFSRDGLNWESGRCGGASACEPLPLNAVLFAEGTFIAIGINSIIYSSLDGQNWRAIEIPPEQEDFYGACFASGEFVIVGEAPACPCGFAAAAEDGFNWNPSIVDDLPFLRSVAYGNGTFVAVGLSDWGLNFSSTNIALTTNILSSWGHAHSAATNDLFSIAFGRGRFVAGGREHHTGLGSVISSTNGVIWTEATIPATNSIRHVTFAANTFLASDDAGQLLSSVDGLAWVLHQPFSAPVQCGIVYANGALWTIASDRLHRSAPLLQLDLSVGSDVELIVSGVQGQNYLIEGTEDIANGPWDQLGSLTLYDSPTLWRDNRARSEKARFYRVRTAE